MPRLTIAEARQQLSAVGYSLRVNDGEYRVAPKYLRPSAAELFAYRTNDLQDAVDTARLIGGGATQNHLRAGVSA